MTINESIKIYEKARQELIKAEEAAKAAEAIKEKAREAARAADISIFRDKSHPLMVAYYGAIDKRDQENKKVKFATAVFIASKHNVLNVAANTLRAAIIENPEKFKAPTHHKRFIEAVKEITGKDFYLDNSLSGSLYLNYVNLPGNSYSAYICEKDHTSGKLNINPEKLTERYNESTLKEIKTEARKAVKDAEKIRKAAAALEAMTSATRANYKTYIYNYIPYFNKYDLKDNNNL